MIVQYQEVEDPPFVWSPEYLALSMVGGAWLDPSDPATIFQDAAATTPATTSGQTIERVNDKTGLGNHATKGTPSAPTYSASPINGLTALSCTAQILQANGVASIFSGTDKPWTVHVVYRATTIGTGRYPISVASSSSSTQNITLGGGVNSASGQQVSRRDNGSTQVILSAGSTSVNAVEVMTYRCNGTTLDVWRNGAHVMVASSFDVGSSTLNLFNIGGYFRNGSLSSNMVGHVGEVLVLDRAEADADVRRTQRYLVQKWLSEPAGQTLTVDLFAIAGQSNAEGRGDSSTSPAVALGQGFYLRSVTPEPLDDPVGGASTGSAWPAFANAYFAATGRVPVFVETATGGASLIQAANTGTGYWDPAGGASLYSNARAVLLNAKTWLQAHEFWTLGTVNVLWVQGETDGDEVDGSTVTGAIYEGLLNDLIDAYDNDVGIDNFIISELGKRRNGDLASQYAEIRAAQGGVVASHAKASFGFTGAKNFGTSDMSDTYHYTQASLNTMGAAMGAHAATLV